MYRIKYPAVVLACLLLLPRVLASGQEVGEASWYGPGFHGRKTANGEIFDKEALTAAHRTLPFGTLLSVKNLDNGRQVVVRVNDRGPFARDRVLDLSEAAARRLGMIETGTAHVRITIVSSRTGDTVAGGYIAGTSAPAGTGSPSESPAVVVRIQVASYKDEGNAARALNRLKLSGFSPSLEKGGGYTRVVISGVSVQEKDVVVRRLADLGYPGVLVRVETRL